MVFMHTLNDVFNAKNVTCAAETAKFLNYKPLILNGKILAYYTDKNLVSSNSKLAIPVGNKIIEMRAITKAGINQIHNIIKLYDIKTIHYKGKHSEHLLFTSTNLFDTIIYDQLRLKCINQQHGVFINLRHAYAIIPPTVGFKILSSYDIADFPNDLYNDLFCLHCNDVVKGSFNG
jgi:hypothetical protein